MKTADEIAERISEIEDEKRELQKDYINSIFETERSIIAERNVQKSMMINNLKWVLS